MQLSVNGAKVYAGTGGRDFDPGQPVVVFLHGAGFDHTVWPLLARWFAHHGMSVLAPDLPGHGRSEGDPLTSIGAMAEWVIVLLESAGAGKAVLVGHSMGSLVALEAAARFPERVAGLGLINCAAAMPVSRDLLAAAQANDHAAIDMITIWAHGYRAGIGGSLAPGMWMRIASERVLEHARRGVLLADFSACNDYRDGLTAAAKVNVPAVLILGERDLMTPAKNGRALAAVMPQARSVAIAGAGHMLMSEHPDEVLAALRELAAQPVG